MPRQATSALGTLHANNANQALERILNFFPIERHLQIYMQLSLNLKAIISQRLIPSVDGKRVAAIEILLDTPRVKDLITERGDRAPERDHGRRLPGRHADLRPAYPRPLSWRAGSDYENAIAYADSPNDLRIRIKVSGAKKVERPKPLKLRMDEQKWRRKVASDECRVKGDPLALTSSLCTRHSSLLSKQRPGGLTGRPAARESKYRA